jgi:hypothetical protein
MAEVICVRAVWGDHLLGPLPWLPPIPGVRLHQLHYGPEPGYPFGRRGLAIAGAWEQLRTARSAGLLLLDADVAVDPWDFAAMLGAVELHPADVLTAPIRVWPASTTRSGWTWGHWTGQPGQGPCPDPEWFSLSFTYLPERLVAACLRAGLRKWTFPVVDSRISETARAAGIPARVVDQAAPKHLHY